MQWEGCDKRPSWLAGGLVGAVSTLDGELCGVAGMQVRHSRYRLGAADGVIRGDGMAVGPSGHSTRSRVNSRAGVWLAE